MSILRTLETITLDGGALPFHFINTVRDRKVEHIHNYLTSYQDLIIWTRRMKLMNEAELGELENFANKNPDEANQAYARAISLRETMYAMFSAIADHKQPNQAVVDAFNGFLSEALSRLSLIFAGGRLSFEIKSDEDINLNKPIFLVLNDTYRLLNEEDRSRMKECQKCGWIFLDHTKNNTKLWCNPQICGSTSKSTRYYHRKKRAKQGGINKHEPV